MQVVRRDGQLARVPGSAGELPCVFSLPKSITDSFPLRRRRYSRFLRASLLSNPYRGPPFAVVDPLVPLYPFRNRSPVALARLPPRLCTTIRKEAVEPRSNDRVPPQSSAPPPKPLHQDPPNLILGLSPRVLQLPHIVQERLPELSVARREAVLRVRPQALQFEKEEPLRPFGRRRFRGTGREDRIEVAHRRPVLAADLAGELLAAVAAEQAADPLTESDEDDEPGRGLVRKGWERRGGRTKERLRRSRKSVVVIGASSRSRPWRVRRRP